MYLVRLIARVGRVCSLRPCHERTPLFDCFIYVTGDICLVDRGVNLFEPFALVRLSGEVYSRDRSMVTRRSYHTLLFHRLRRFLFE